MHELEPKHTKLKPEEVEKLSEDYNVSVSQLPKMKLDDSAIPAECQSGDVVKIERKFGDEMREYFRVVA